MEDALPEVSGVSAAIDHAPIQASLPSSPIDASHLAQSIRREMDIHEAKVKDFELKRKMKTTVVPTDDVRVRQMLRQLVEPITLFGEKEVCACVCVCS